MTTEYSGAGDPRRSMELLWETRPPARRGPRPRLTVAAIARVAIDIADRDGLAALSMRRVAEQLGVTAMSLYTYVPGKAELLDVMLDTVYGELPEPAPTPTPTPEDWRTRLDRIVRDNRALYLRHPWLLRVATSRPVLGPNLLARYERELTALTGLGLTDIEMDLVLTMLGDYAHGAARAAVEASQAASRTGVTDAQWWESYGPLLENVLDPERYPLAVRVGGAAGAEYGGATDPERSFEFGLARLLDGIAVFLTSRTSG